MVLKVGLGCSNLLLLLSTYQILFLEFRKNLNYTKFYRDFYEPSLYFIIERNLYNV